MVLPIHPNFFFTLCSSLSLSVWLTNPVLLWLNGLQSVLLHLMIWRSVCAMILFYVQALNFLSLCKLIPLGEEVRCSSVEEKASAVKRALDTLKYYLIWKFGLEIDYWAMEWIFWLKDTNAKIRQWYLFLQLFQYQITVTYLSTLPSPHLCFIFFYVYLLSFQAYYFLNIIELLNTSYYPSYPWISPYIQLEFPPSSNFIPWWQTKTCFSYFYYIFHYTALGIQHENFFV